MFLLDDKIGSRASTCRTWAAYPGIASVLAIDRATGAKVWESPLKGGDFVNVELDEGQLYAATKGELHCLGPATGAV
jgi:outer membrane protein assembly factor BamB